MSAWNRVAAAFYSFDGREITPGRDTHCPAPGHGRGRGDRRPSLSIEVGEMGVLLRCHVGCSFHQVIEAIGLTEKECFNGPSEVGSTQVSQGPKVPRTQGDVGRRAAGAEGGRDTKKNSEGGGADSEMDHLLALHAAGRIEVEVSLPSIPPDLPEPQRQVLAFFALCVALRRWADMDEPYEVRFSRYWVAGHTGLHEQTVKRALTALQRPRHPLATGGLLVFVRETDPRRDRDQARGTYVFAPGWLVDADAEEVPAARPALAGSVEADDAGRVDERQEVGEHAAVRGAVAVDRGEVLEGDGGLGAAVAGAGGVSAESSHASHHNRPSGGGPPAPRNAIFGPE